MWMRDDDAIYVPPDEPGEDTLTVCPAAIIREWCALAAAAAPEWIDRRHHILSVYPILVGRN